MVAELNAPRVRADASVAAQQRAELARQGLLAPAKASPRARLPRRRPVAKLAELLRELDGDRA
jgi:hypothetical protein